MCLAIPGKILSIDGDTARIEVLGSIKKANLALLDNPCEGEYVLVHAGFVIERVDTKRAEETLSLIGEL